MDDGVIEALRRALTAVPDDTTLRLHLAQSLLDAGRADEAVAECATALQRDPTSAQARELMTRALTPDAPPPPPPPTTTPPTPPPAEVPDDPDAPPGPHGFDWGAAEQQVGDVAAPMFVDDEGAPEPEQGAWDVEKVGIGLADVGGLQEVKDRLEAAFLAPLRNPELRRLYGKSLRGGLLLYGPPGCGKTYVARAVAGEMGAKFISVGMNDVLDMWIGTSERNLHELFMLARRSAPVVLFLDEIDALGQKRSQTRSSAMRTTVNQLLTELDGVGQDNEGVFVLAATNQPWDVDPALRRPGRLDRTLLVLPPDQEAREAIVRHHLKERPVEGIDVRRIAKRTDGYSGADLAHVCESAAERALLDGVRTGRARLIGMADLEWAVGQVRPSTRGWFDTARNVVMFADNDGTYADLRTWMKKHKLL
ncbi:ATP-binding protein [Angustibacter speluncae]